MKNVQVRKIKIFQLEKRKYSNQKKENIPVRKRKKYSNQENENWEMEEQQQDKNKRIRPREQAGGQKYGAKSSPIIIIPIPVACLPLGQGLELVSKELNHLAAI